MLRACRVRWPGGAGASRATGVNCIQKMTQESYFCYFNSVYITNKQAVMGKTILSISCVNDMEIKGSWIPAIAQNVGQSISMQFNPLIHAVNKCF